MNIRIGLIICCLFLGWNVQAQESKMSESEVTKFKAAMAKAEKISTLSADFTQYKKVGYVKNELKSSGRFYIKNPDRLAWVYTSPLQYSMIFKDKKIYINDRGKKKSMDLSRNKQFEKISQAIHTNISGGSYQDSGFTPSYYKSPTHYLLKLSPVGKDVGKTMKQIILHFDKANYQVSEIELLEASGGYTRFVMTNQKLNAPLDDAVFNAVQ